MCIWLPWLMDDMIQMGIELLSVQCRAYVRAGLDMIIALRL